MIKFISSKVVGFLVNNEAIKNNPDTIEVYSYGVEISISSLCNIIIILLLGALLKTFRESIVFLICFVPLRSFTGGYHADTYFKCNLYFGLLFLLLIWAYKFTLPISNIYFNLLLFVIGLVFTAKYAPIENKNKTIDISQKQRYKYISIILYFLLGIIAFICIMWRIKVGLIILYTLSLDSVLIIADRWKIRIKNKNKEAQK